MSISFLLRIWLLHAFHDVAGCIDAWIRPMQVPEACQSPGSELYCADYKTMTGAMCACRDPQADVAGFQEQGGTILVGTPGRLSDIFERSKVLDARKLEVLVLDEADRLLDAGYGKHLENLMRKLPKQRRTGALCLQAVCRLYSDHLILIKQWRIKPHIWPEAEAYSCPVPCDSLHHHQRKSLEARIFKLGRLPEGCHLW